MVEQLKASIILLGDRFPHETSNNEYDLHVLMEVPNLEYPNRQEVRVNQQAGENGHLAPAYYGRSDFYKSRGFMQDESGHRALSYDEARAAMTDAKQQLKGLLSAAAKFVRRSTAGVALDGNQEVDVPGRSGLLGLVTADRFELRRNDDGTVKVYARATSENPGEIGGGISFNWVSAQCKLIEDGAGTTCEAGAKLYINDQIGGASPRYPSVGLWNVQDPDILRDIAAVVIAGSKD